MADHRQVLAAVRRDAVAAGLARISGLDALVRLVISAAVIITAYLLALAAGRWPVTLLSGLVTGYVLLSLPAIAHEAVHGHLARNWLANRLGGILSSAIALVPYSSFRYFHLEHHAHTATARDSEVYPERYSRRRFLLFPFEQMTFVLLLWRWTWQTVAGRPPRWVRDARQVRAVAVDAAATILVVAALTALVMVLPGPAWVLWPGSLPLASLLYSYSVMPEHFGARMRATPTPDQLGYTATVRSNAVTRAVMWNSNFHAAHHFMPSVPARGLPGLDERIRELQPAEWRFRGYGRWYVSTLGTLDDHPWNGAVAESAG